MLLSIEETYWEKGIIKKSFLKLYYYVIFEGN